MESNLLTVAFGRAFFACALLGGALPPCFATTPVDSDAVAAAQARVLFAEGQLKVDAVAYQRALLAAEPSLATAHAALKKDAFAMQAACATAGDECSAVRAKVRSDLESLRAAELKMAAACDAAAKCTAARAAVQADQARVDAGLIALKATVADAIVSVKARLQEDAMTLKTDSAAAKSVCTAASDTCTAARALADAVKTRIALGEGDLVALETHLNGFLVKAALAASSRFASAVQGRSL